METVLRVLNTISKDKFGFDDLDEFWDVTDTIDYPSGELFRTLVDLKTNPVDEFNYDTSSTFSDVDEDEDEHLLSRSRGGDSDDDGTAFGMKSILLSPTSTVGNKSGRTSRGSVTSSGAGADDEDDGEDEKEMEAGSELDDSDDGETVSPASTVHSGRSSTARGRRSSAGSSRAGTSVSAIDYSDGPSESSIEPEPPSPDSTEHNTTINSMPTSVTNGGMPSSGSRRSSLNGSSSSSRAGAATVSASKDGRRVSFGGDFPQDNDNDDDGNDYYDPEYDDASRLSTTPVNTGDRRSSSAGNKHRLSGEIGAGISPIDGGAQQTPRSSGRKGRPPRTQQQEKLSLSMISTPGSAEFTRGRRLSDASFAPPLDDDQEEDEVETDVEDESGDVHRVTDQSSAGAGVDESSFVDNSFLGTIAPTNQRYIGNDPEKVKKLKKVANLQHNPPKKRRGRFDSSLSSDDEGAAGQSSEEENSSQEEGGRVRRSRRVTKGRRFAYWKGERPVYQQGTIVDISAAAVTPAKRKRENNGKRGALMKGDKSVKTRIFSHDDDDEVEFDQGEGDRHRKGPPPLPPVPLPSDVSFINIDKPDTTFNVWDDSTDVVTHVKIVSKAANVRSLALPKTAQRPAGKDKVGFAAHAFNVPETDGKMSGWISGHVQLPPEAIKDAEAVGQYSQVFFVSECQEGALEVGIADPEVDVWNDDTAQRVLLGKGDSFYVPPGNIYRLENHSQAVTAMLFWTLIRPLENGVAAATAGGAHMVAENQQQRAAMVN